MVAWLYITSFSCLPAYSKVQLDIKNEMMCVCTGGREGGKQQKKLLRPVIHLYFTCIFLRVLKWPTFVQIIWKGMWTEV